MEKSKIGNKNKFLLLAFLCIYWFVRYSYSFIISYQNEKLIQSVVIILAFVITTVFYYICKNRILRLLVMISAIVCITVVIGYRYMLSVFAAFAIIYVYKSLDAEDLKNEIINGILFVLAALTSIVGLIINFEAIIGIEAETVIILAIFVISFLILRKCAQEKKSNKKTKKSHKTIKPEKNFETLHETVFSISIIGVVSSAASFTLNNAIAFFPWFFFIALLIYEEDESLYSASEMIVDKIKAFVE